LGVEPAIVGFPFPFIVKAKGMILRGWRTFCPSIFFFFLDLLYDDEEQNE
jgi:hypothetical protein